MQNIIRWTIAGGLVLAGLQISGDQHPTFAAGGKSGPKVFKHGAPAKIEAVAGSDLKLIILTEKAIERTGLEIGTVRETQVSGDPAAAPVKRKSVPYASLIYDENGRTWVYISPKERTFVRHPVEVDYIEGDTAILRDGPPPDTKVATYGAAELWGEEGGIGH